MICADKLSRTAGTADSTGDIVYAFSSAEDAKTLLARLLLLTDSGNGLRCYGCTKRYAAGEPIYGDYVDCYYVYYCASCAPVCGRSWRACDTCSRAVFQPVDLVKSAKCFCSSDCSRCYRGKVQRESRAAARRKKCAECSISFEATRSDAKYCCKACKQRAYRRRLPAKKSVTATAHDVRHRHHEDHNGSHIGFNERGVSSDMENGR